MELLEEDSEAEVELLEEDSEAEVELLEVNSETEVEMLDSVESDCSLASLTISGVSISMSSDKSVRLMLT